jgi:DNA-binding MarR family transcriptional regulator
VTTSSASTRDLGGLLAAASSGLSTLGDRVLRPLTVTSAQWKVLVVLARQGPARISHLVNVLDHDQAAVSRLVSRMERAGLVRRRVDPGDARAGVVTLTALGRRAYQRCDQTLSVVMRRLERSMSSREQAQLRRLLTSFTRAIAAELEP